MSIGTRGLGGLHEQTAGTSSSPKPKDAAHNFVADASDHGYRPLCRICGKPQTNHPYLSTPRRPK